MISSWGSHPAIKLIQKAPNSGSSATSTIPKTSPKKLSASSINQKEYCHHYHFAQTGGRDEILRAVKKIVTAGIKSEDITEEKFASCLDTTGIPDPDLIIRTGGEKRLSGYLPWQSVYAELYFTPVLFPDFTPAELDKALDDFTHRDRRFGGDPKAK